MGINKKSARASLFAAVFGIVCLMITGAVGYAIAKEAATDLMLGIAITLVFTMWMTYVGVFVDLSDKTS
jgi:hypothetical protein